LTFGLAFADFDNDAWPDLMIANGHIESDIARIRPEETFEQPCVLFRNLGKGSFANVSVTAGASITDPMVGRALCRGDFDNDGKMDVLVIGNRGAPRLLRNETRRLGHWVTLRLIGTRWNRDAYGASVTIEAGGGVQTAYLSSGSSYLAAHDARVHFGLGNAAAISKVTIRWPDGSPESYGNIPIDQIVTIRQGSAVGAKGSSAP
jgi:hypothetical protein